MPFEYKPFYKGLTGVKGFTGIRLLNKFIGYATEVGLQEEYSY